MSSSQCFLNEQAATAAPKVVLVIEDSPTQAMIVQQLLSDMGLETLVAQTGMAGLSSAIRECPDLIILDVQMPDINGFEVCNRLKKCTETKDIPIIIFTRNNGIDAAHHGIESGAVEFIPKDAFAKAVLIETLRQMGLVSSDKMNLMHIQENLS